MCFITLLQLHKTFRIYKAVLTLKFFLRSFHLPYFNYHLYLGMLGFCSSIFRERLSRYTIPSGNSCLKHLSVDSDQIG